jgi:hypothetical protein
MPQPGSVEDVLDVTVALAWLPKDLQKPVLEGFSEQVEPGLLLYDFADGVA